MAGSTTPVAARSPATDATSGIASCTSPTYGGGDGAPPPSPERAQTSPATRAPRQASASSTTRPPPAVTASPDRKPDGKGWYRKPLTVSFAGTDATSGIAACTAPTRYAGPDLAKAAVVGACRDAAGNTAEAGQAFQYDATAPKLPVAKAEVEKGVAKIVWKRSPDAVLVELERSPGMNGRKKTDRLPRQRRELHRQDRPRRRPLPLRDQGERRGGEHGGEGRHGERRPAGALPAHGRRGRAGAARPLLGGRSRERPSTTSSSTGTR